MQIPEVIAVDVAIGRCLPVAAVEHGLDVVAVQLLELQVGQRRGHVAEPVVDVEGDSWSEHREHCADPLGRGQFDEPLDVDSLEGLAIGVTDQRTLGVVHPEVVWAGEAPGMTEATVGHGCTAVPADIQERARHTIIAAHDHDGALGDDQGGEVAGARDVARHGDQQWTAAEDLFELLLEAGLVAVFHDGHVQHRLAVVTVFSIDVGQQALGDIGERRCGHGGLP